MNTRLVSVLAAALACAGCAGLRKPPLPAYDALRAAGPITVDGRLDEPSWRAAKEVGPFQFPWWTSGQKEQTIVKILWDDDNLYLAYFCLDRHISAIVTQRDASVYEDDTVEAFIAPNPDEPKKYINFEINCRGVCMDSRPHTPEGRAWSAEGLECQGLIWGTLNRDDDTDYCWTMEVKIPLKNFACYAKRIPPRPGDVWRIGLNRCGGQTNAQYSQWSSSATPKPAFHVPSRFGFLRFSDAVVGQAASPRAAPDE